MKTALADLVATALDRLAGDALPIGVRDTRPQIDRTRDPRHGDFACNVAMTLAKPAGRRPREIAELIVAALPESGLVAAVDIAGPGFINFRLSDRAFQQEIRRVLEAGADYGRSDGGGGRRVIVEFVSANPTGPLHVGHGRHAAYGDSLASLLEATGHDVHREYYVNDAGRQMDILALSVWLRYLETRGESVPFPANGYRGGYIREIAEALARDEGDRLRRPAAEVLEGVPDDAPAGDKEAHVDGLIGRARALLGPGDYRLVLDAGLDAILGDIRDDLAGFGVRIDQWYSERSLADSGRVAQALERLRSEGQVYERDGAVWFRASDFGDEKDRVVVRDNGQTTYIASDVAYHLDKRLRGFELLLDVLGADHHGYVARVRAGLEAMGEPPESLEVRLIQFAVLYRGGEKVQMSTRSGEFVTLRELREEVGDDAARLFYVLRSNDQHLDFDLDLAKSRSNENPVYYIQYAHARICSVFRQLEEKGLVSAGIEAAALERLTEDHEKALMSTLGRYPEVVALAAANRAPQNVVQYLRELAQDFHTYYNAHTFIVEDAGLREARLALIAATRQVLGNALGLIGVSAPERM